MRVNVVTAEEDHALARTAVILAGGFGTRLMEETETRPKPTVEIGGITNFVVCLGYKGYLIKEYFANYFLHMSDVTIDFARNTREVHRGHAEPWSVALVDTGAETMTGGRLRRVRKYLGPEPFCMTYGDAVSTVDIRASVASTPHMDAWPR